MVHYSRLSDVVVDVPAGVHDSEMAFWSAATGEAQAQLGSHPEYHRIKLAGQDIGLLIQQLGDGLSRVHVDIHTDDVDAEVSRLERLGAERIERVHTWWIMRDPAGLLFCVVSRPPESFSDSNAHRWE